MKESTRLIITYSLIAIVGFTSGLYSDKYPVQTSLFFLFGFIIIGYWSWVFMKGR